MNDPQKVANELVRQCLQSRAPRMFKVYVNSEKRWYEVSIEASDTQDFQESIERKYWPQAAGTMCGCCGGSGKA